MTRKEKDKLKTLERRYKWLMKQLETEHTGMDYTKAEAAALLWAIGLIRLTYEIGDEEV
jgi:hypothetical protein